MEKPRLNPEDLVVASFPTSEGEAVVGPVTTIGPYDPTPMTMCYWCPPDSVDCPFTQPGTVIG